ncbi:BadF/BadG/BcrA/BcrD ATPase family protein [Kitasatospora gansuensis]
MTGAPLVLGLDVGGSTTRVLLADLDGRVLAGAEGAGGNPVAHGETAAAQRILDTLRAALAEVDPARVTAGVIGLVGGLIVATALDRVWSAAGLLITPRLVSDLELAYAAGTFGPAGSVLLSGTGAAAAHCRDFRPVRTADGHGWLLGDRGSGYWLGRAAVETALAANDRGELDGLAAQVVRTLVGPHPPGPRARSAVIAAAHADAPVRLARLAPLVLTAATAGDPQARGWSNARPTTCSTRSPPSAHRTPSSRWCWRAVCSHRTPRSAPKCAPASPAAGPTPRSPTRATPRARPPGWPPVNSAPPTVRCTPG